LKHVANGQTVLLIEDDCLLASAMARGLTEDGFDVRHEQTGVAGLRFARQASVAAIILDLGLPDMDGLTLVREARSSNLGVPILIVSGRDAVPSRVEGLETGADDYLTKPFAYAELLARLRALIRRSAAPTSAPVGGDLVLMSDLPQVLVEGRSVMLSPREHALLELLAQRRGEILGRSEILRDVFGYNFDPGTNLVDVHIAHLRRKLGSAASLVQTVRGWGYRLKHAQEAAR
jgi:DNA-binding response OmpR family regulator